MSAESTPITLTRFATALSDLPIDAIYSKHTELRNAIAHMAASNTQLEEYARENDDRECYEALLENRQVMGRFEERIGALKREVVEVRGLPWRPREEEGKNEVEGDGVNGTTANGVVATEQRGEGGAGAGVGAEGEDGVFL